MRLIVFLLLFVESDGVRFCNCCLLDFSQLNKAVLSSCFVCVMCSSLGVIIHNYKKALWITNQQPMLKVRDDVLICLQYHFHRKILIHVCIYMIQHYHNVLFCKLDHRGRCFKPIILPYCNINQPATLQ